MLIGVLNLIILISLINLFAKLRREHIEEAEVDALLESRGFVSRFVGPYFKLITRSWHVLPLGFLFGLGFDTASEIALLALSSAHHNKQLSYRNLIFTNFIRIRYEFIDTFGVVMKYAYNWAFWDSYSQNLLQYNDYCDISHGSISD